jgi:outer membrane receptor protein involved in Fe transport
MASVRGAKRRGGANVFVSVRAFRIAPPDQAGLDPITSVLHWCTVSRPTPNKNGMNKSLAVILLAMFLASGASANARANADVELEKLMLSSMEELLARKIKISTNTDQILHKAPSVVTVITAEDIKATGATELTDILRSVPGVFVRSNLFAFRPQVTFRGAAGTHTLLMVNGEPIKDLVWSSGIFWKGLPSSMIERIEIIRGPGSALFGSDASAGVINVITKATSMIPQSEAGVRAGSFDTQAAWVNLGGEWNGFEIGLSAELSRTGGHEPFFAADGQTARDNAVGTLVSHAPSHARYGWRGQDFRFSIAKGNWHLLADHTGYRDLEIGLTGAGVLDTSTRAHSHRNDIALFYNDEAFTRDWGLNAELRYYHLEYSSGQGFFERPPGYSPDGINFYPDGQINRMRSSENGLRFELSGLYSGVRNHAIRLGGGHSIRDLHSVEQFVNFGTGADGNPLPAGGPLVDLTGSPHAFAPEKTRRISHLYLQDIWTLSPAWELTAGARYDRYSDFGGTLNPRLALVWQSTDRLTTKLMYGRAFRAPSYLELYARTAATNPNPNLTPERSETWDLSLNYLASKDLRLGLVLYQFAQSDLIAANAATLNTFQNIGDRTARGAELETQWQASKTLRLAGNLSLSKEKGSLTSGNPLPTRTAYLRADWTLAPDWHWNLQANWVGKRKLAATDPRASIGAYTVVDSTVRYFHRENWELAASIRNLFDVDAREYSSRALLENLPLPRRSLHVEALFKF